MPLVDVSQWPLLLCGPVLRRVESRSLSVFVALKYPRNVKLSVYRYGAGGAGVPTLVQSGNDEPTLAFGKFFHAKVSTVTITLATPLHPGELYGYNVQFTRTGNDPGDTGPAVQDLGPLPPPDRAEGALGCPTEPPP